MLIRIGGGRAGIKEYLESGRKDGRDYDREELDERVILSGDLEVTDSIINNMQKTGERYLHITLSFKEDSISREQLQAVTDDFKAFAFSAYAEDEFNMHAEAHLPKLKSYVNQKTGELVERLPHIHIVIPTHNLLTGQNLNPLGKVDQQTAFLDAFQEHTNAKYGLASPKDHRRAELTNESTIISRYKGDTFTGPGEPVKRAILADVLAKDVTDYDQFKALAATHGTARARNAGTDREYLNIKPEGAAKGVNLKEYAFSREFIALPDAQKRAALDKVQGQGYAEAQPSRVTPDDRAATLKQWHEVRARELKYINSGSRKAYAAYREADPEQKRAILADREKAFYAKHRAAPELVQEKPKQQQAHDQVQTAALGQTPKSKEQAVDQVQTAALGQQPKARGTDGRHADSVVGQLDAERKETAKRTATPERAEFDTIKRELSGDRLLAHVSRTHGVQASKYSVMQGQGDGDRIRAGKRDLNVTDFVTKELNLPWKEATGILRQAYAEQRGQDGPQEARQAPSKKLWTDYRKEWPAQQRERREQAGKEQKQADKGKRADVREAYQTQRRSVTSDRSMTPVERKAALSVLRMDKVNTDAAVREAIAIERAELKARFAGKPIDHYRSYLTERAGKGDTEALAELRKQREHSPRSNNGQGEVQGRSHAQETTPTLDKRASYTVDRAGNVTYYDQQKAAMFTDTGSAVQFAKTDPATLEKGLRLAMLAHGNELKLRGTGEYKQAMADTAARAGIVVVFSDEAVQKRYNDTRQKVASEAADLETVKQYIDKANERPAPTDRGRAEQGATKEQGKAAEKAPQEQEKKQRQEKDHDTGRGR